MSFKRSIIVLLVAAVMIFAFAGSVLAVPADVEGTKYEKAVGKLYAIDVMEGYPDGTFRPDGDITRAEFSKIAVLSMGLGHAAKANVGESVFPDTRPNVWYSGYVTVAADRGFIEGYPDGTFRPNDNLTNAEAMTILLRMVGLGPVVEREGTWPSNYIGRAATEGILDNVTVAGGAKAKRGDVAQMLVDTLDVKMWDSIGYDHDGTVRYGRTDDTLLSKRLKIAEVKDARVIDIERVGTDEGEIKIKRTKSPSYEGTLDLKTAHCPEYLFGLEVEVWINDDDEIIWLAVETAAKDIIYDSVVASSEDEIELKVKDDEYDWASGAVAYENFGSKIDGNDLANITEGAYGKFVLDGDGDVIFAVLFDFDEITAGYVTDVDGDEIEYRDEADKENLYLDEYDDVYVYNPHFEKVGAGAVEEGVVIYAWADNDDEINIVAVDSKVTGNLDRTRTADIRVAGNDYDVVSGISTFSTDENESFDSYGAEAAKDLIGESVTLVLDINGDFRHVYGDVEVTTDVIYAIAMDAYVIGRSAYIEVFTPDGDDVEYKFDTRADANEIVAHFDDDPIDEFKYNTDKPGFVPVAFKLDKDGEIAEDKFWIVHPDTGKIDDKDVRKFDGTFKFDDKNNYIEEGNKRAYIANDTVLMKYELADDENEDLVSWDRIKGADNTDNLKAMVVGDNNRNAAFVVFYKNYNEIADDELYGIVVEDAYYDGDDWITTIDIAGFGLLEYVVASSRALLEGDILEFSPTAADKVQLVNRDADLKGSMEYQLFGKSDSNRSSIGDHVYKYEAVYYEVVSRDGNDLKVKKGGDDDPFKLDGSEKWFRVAADAVIYKTDDKGDLDGTERLTRIRSGDKVVFVIDDNSVIQAIVKVDKDFLK